MPSPVFFGLFSLAIREALLCTFSISWMSLARCGDHTGLVYSKIGRTRDLYKIECLSKFAFFFKSRFIINLPTAIIKFHLI